MVLLHEWMDKIQWLNIEWLWIFSIVFIVLLLLIRTGWLQLKSLTSIPFNLGRKVFRHSMPSILMQLKSGESVHLRHKYYAMRWLGLVMLAILSVGALAGPYVQGKRIPDPVPHREVIFIIDTSISMSLRDYVVNGERVDRMTMLKNVMHYFIDQLQGNRIGILVFSETAYALSPLTNDYSLLSRQLDRIQPAMLTGRTTDISYGLMYVLNHLQQNNLDNVEHKPALVLLSDVKRPSRDISPLIVARQFKELGFSLHTIAVGSGEAQADQASGMDLIYQPANFALLTDIAQAGGGRFFMANNTESLKQAVLKIQDVEQREVEQAPRYIQLGLYQWPLMILLGFLLILQLLRVIRA